MTRLWHDPDRVVAVLAAAVADAALDGSDEAAAFASAAGALLGRAGCLVHRYEEEQRLLVCVAAGPPFEQAVWTVRTPLGSGVAGWVASRARPVVVTDRRRDPRGDHLAGLAAEPAGSFVSGAAVPVPRYGGYVGGVVEVYGPAPAGVTDADLRVLARAAALLRDTAVPSRLDGRDAVAAQEAERRRLAADLHDGVTQRLASLRFRLSAAAAGADAGDVSFVCSQLDEARALTDLALDETRAAIRDLGPPDVAELGLPEALSRLVHDLPGPEASMRADTAYPPPAGHVATALYRVAQEALHNVVRHAGARTVTVGLDCGPDAVVLTVADDGIGLPPDARAAARATGGDRGLGLAGMRERAQAIGADLELSSSPSGGTTVRVTARNAQTGTAVG